MFKKLENNLEECISKYLISFQLEKGIFKYKSK